MFNLIKMQKLANRLNKRGGVVNRWIARKIVTINYYLHNSSIPAEVEIGENCSFGYEIGVVIHRDVVIGDNCTIAQNVTIGGKNGPGVPTIGNNVYLGCGCCVLGKVHVGDGAIVGANAVVTEDVPPNAVVIGIPGKVLRYKNRKDYIKPLLEYQKQ